MCFLTLTICAVFQLLMEDHVNKNSIVLKNLLMTTITQKVKIVNKFKFKALTHMYKNNPKVDAYIYG